MKLYAISGLGADERVFQFLNIEAEVISLNWIPPQKEEQLKDYALRLAKIINVSEPFALMGVSFGGLIATEISKELNPLMTILISSTDVDSGLRNMYGWVGKMRVLHLIPKKAFDIPSRLASKLFGTKNIRLLHAILADADLGFTKWAVIALTQWKNNIPLEKCIKITGTNDILIPAKMDDHTFLINGGAHFMVVDRADEISQIINDSIIKFTQLP